MSEMVAIINITCEKSDLSGGGGGKKNITKKEREKTNNKCKNNEDARLYNDVSN